jgi:hypothetical protein
MAKKSRKDDTGYDSHDWVLRELKRAQEADQDNREMAREAELFVLKRDGQWEPTVQMAATDKPRYTFDIVGSIVDQVTGTLQRTDFDIRVRPAGGNASIPVAVTYDGLIRNIENLSKSSQKYARVSRRMVMTGFDAMRVTQQYVDDDSFDQDLIIDRIHNATDRVWWGPHEEPDASDAQFCFVLSGLTREQYEKEFPDASDASVSSDRQTDAYYHRRDLVMVGEFIYLKDRERTLVKMSNGAIHAATAEFETIRDELAMAGIVEVERRTRSERVVCSRLFNTHEWLTESRETVFRNWVPVVPCYANFEVVEDKVIYQGIVERLMDPQRVMNYSISREIEEGALAPRAKYWMTEKQAQGHEQTLSTLNTNSDPVQFFNPDERLPGTPQQSGGASINPGLQAISSSMRDILGQISGMFAANMGENPGLQSGIAIDLLQDRGDVGANKFMLARSTMQEQLGRILVDAIPRVYEPGRQVRVLGEDGTTELETIGQMVLDQQTQRPVVLNDLSQGKYDVVCVSGPSFRSRQSETVRTMTELGKVDPSVIEMGADILLSNVPAPGMDDLAARKRAQLVAAGVIPMDQLTDEERTALQQAQAQGNQQPDANMALAMAEQAKADASMAEVQRKAQQAQLELQFKMAQLQLDMEKAQTDAQFRQQELQLKMMQAENDRLKLQIELAEAQASIANNNAGAMKTLAEAEAQQLENDSTISGVRDLLGAIGGPA